MACSPSLFRTAFRQGLSDQALRGDPGRVCSGSGNQIPLPERRSSWEQLFLATLRAVVVVSCLASVLSACTIHVHLSGPMGACDGFFGGFGKRWPVPFIESRSACEDGDGRESF